MQVIDSNENLSSYFSSYEQSRSDNKLISCIKYNNKTCTTSGDILAFFKYFNNHLYTEEPVDGSLMTSFLAIYPRSLMLLIGGYVGLHERHANQRRQIEDNGI